MSGAMPHKHKKNLMDLRRAKILELLSSGYSSQSEISEKIGVSLATVGRDIRFIKVQAQDSLKKHIENTIPFEYTKAMEGLRRVLFETNKMLAKENLDDRTKLQALQLLTQVHRNIMDMTADGSVVQLAIQRVRELQKRQEQGQGQEQNIDVTIKEEQTEEEDEDSGEENETETEEQE